MTDNASHGHNRRGQRTAEYRAWVGLKTRCHRTTGKDFKNYGARGIKVCARWDGPHGFINFLADMGMKPTPLHTIERENNDGDYEPSNCIWATRDVQNNNRRPLTRTHCKRGHVLEGDNIYVRPNGWKVCIVCRNLLKEQKK